MSFYITTSGRKIELPKFNVADICIEDIAHHLTKICRFGGALELGVHYSVASHSLYLVNYARQEGYSEEVQRYLLLHDASEAYLGDIPSGLKALLPDYKKIEKKVTQLIFMRYNINIPKNKEIIMLDKNIVLDEAASLSPHHYNFFEENLLNYKGIYSPLGIKIKADGCLNYIRSTFLAECSRLDIK